MPINSNSITLPGTAISIKKQGILIQGSSGVGKSELALALIQAGHSLIADDAVILEKKPQHIELYCPEKLSNLLEIRNLGILNIKDLYGQPAITLSMPLRLVIALEKSPTTPLDRLKGSYSSQTLLGLSIPLLTIGCAQQRLLPAIVECVVKKLAHTAS